MRCSNAGCGAVGTGPFCQKCGSKMTERHDREMVICDGERKDGSPCTAFLTPNKKFCNMCGKKVDSALFPQQTCTKCGETLEQGSIFCSECGHMLDVPEIGCDERSIMQKETDFVPSGYNDDTLFAETGHSEKKVERVDNNEQSNYSLETATILMVEMDSAGKKRGPGLSSNNALIEAFNSNNSNPLNSCGLPENINCVTDTELNSNANKDHSKINSSAGIVFKSEESAGAQNTTVKRQDAEKLVKLKATEKSGLQTGEESCDTFGSKTIEVFDSKEGCENINTETQETKTIEAVHNENRHSSTNTPCKYDSNGNVCVSDHEAAAKKWSCQHYNEVENEDNDLVTTGITRLSSKSEDDTKHDGGNKSKGNNFSAHEENNRQDQDIKTVAEQGKLPKTNEEHNKDLKNNSDADKTYKDLGSKKLLKNECDAEKNIPVDHGNAQANLQIPHKVFGDALVWNCEEKENTTMSDSHTVGRLFDVDNKVITPPCVSVEPRRTTNEKLANTATDISKEKDYKEQDIDENKRTAEGRDTVEKRNGTNIGSYPTLTKNQKKKLKKKLKKEEERKKRGANLANDIKESASQTQIRQESCSVAESGKTEGAIHVVFHVLICKEFDFQPDKDELILRIREKQSTWDNQNRVCSFKKKLKDNVFEMEYDMWIAASSITGQNSVHYKYCIHYPQSAEKECIWEHYIKNDNAGEDANRTLHLTKRWENKDTWHQYDGVLAKRPSAWERLRNFIFSWKKELVKYAEEGVDYFCAKILEAEDTSSMAWCIEQIEVLFECYRRIYFHHAKCWHENEMHRFKEVIGGRILTKMLDSIDELDTSIGQKAEMREKQVVISVAVVHTVQTLDLPFKEVKRWQKVCTYLLMVPENENKRCIEIEILDKHFPGQGKKMEESFVWLVRLVTENSRNPCWLFVMPWIHFLSGMCKPFDEPTFDDGHDKKEPVWWGISQIGAKRVSDFQKSAYNWDK